MTCIEFRRWLDEGRPERELSKMNGHVATCLRCEQELRAAIDLERLLAVVVPGAVGADFDEGVIRKLHMTMKTRGWRRVLDFCADVMAEPSVAVSLALASMFAWQYRMLWIAVTGMSDRVVLALDRVLSQAEAMKVFATPAVSTGVALAVAPLIFWISWRVFQTCQNLTMPEA